MLAPPSTPGPIFTATLAVLTGSGIWFAFPSNQQGVTKNLQVVIDKMHVVEEKVEDYILKKDEQVAPAELHLPLIKNQRITSCIFLFVVVSCALLFALRRYWHRNSAPVPPEGTLEITIEKAKAFPTWTKAKGTSRIRMSLLMWGMNR